MWVVQRNHVMSFFTRPQTLTNLPKARFNNPTTLQQFRYFWRGRMTTAIDWIYQVCYILPLNCYSDCPCPSSSPSPILCVSFTQPTVFNSHAGRRRRHGASPLFCGEHSTKIKNGTPRNNGQGGKRPTITSSSQYGTVLNSTQEHLQAVHHLSY